MHDRVRGLHRVSAQAAVLDRHDVPACLAHHDEITRAVEIPRMGQSLRHNLDRPVRGCSADRPRGAALLRKGGRDGEDICKSKKRNE